MAQDSYTFGLPPGESPPNIDVRDQAARDAAAQAIKDAAANAKLIADLRAEIERGDHEIDTAKVKQILAEYLAEHKFGDNQGRAPIASFVPNDLSTIPAFFRFDLNSERRMEGTKSGYAIVMRDSSGNSIAPVRFMAWTDGAIPDLWFGYIMGGNPPQISWSQLTLTIADGSITEMKLAPALLAKINRGMREVRAITYIYAHVNTGQPAPPVPAAADFNATLVPPDGFTFTKDPASTTLWRTDRPVFSVGDLWRLEAQILGTGFDDPTPYIVIAAEAIKDDDKDAQTVDGLTAAQVDAKITQALEARTDLTDAQKAVVRQIITTSVNALGHQTAAQVNSLIQTAIAGLITRDADQDGVILQNTLDIASLKTKTAANTASATGATARTRANMASIRALRNSVADGDITTVEASGGHGGDGERPYRSDRQPP